MLVQAHTGGAPRTLGPPRAPVPGPGPRAPALRAVNRLPGYRPEASFIEGRWGVFLSAGRGGGELYMGFGGGGWGVGECLGGLCWYLRAPGER